MTDMEESVLNHPFVQGLNILAKYSTGPIRIHAEHDIIYAGPPEIEKGDVFKDDVQKLEELGGWHWADEGDCWAFFT
jgi:hypothetical protein